MKEIPIKTTVIKYEASDGTRFDTEYECKNYESSLFGMLMEKLNSAVIAKFDDLHLFGDFYSGEPFNKFYVVVPHTRTDVFNINQILNMCEHSERQSVNPDRLQILCVQLECNEVVNAELIQVDEWINMISSGMFGLVDCTDKEESKENVKKQLK